MSLLVLGSGTSGYQIQRSVRLRSSASAFFNRTPASAGNRQIWTWSAWVKRGGLGSNQFLFEANTNSGSDTDHTDIRFSSTTDTLRFFNDAGGSGTVDLITTQVFRDASAWYHIVIALDTTQATSSNRVKIYINGVQVTAFTTATYPSLNANLFINNNINHRIGNYQPTNLPFDGYLADINFIDGQALTPSSFGEYNPITGVWQPKGYAGTYGTNGFYLKFTDNSAATAAAIGKDFSGNGNNWTPNNISLTAGTTYDSMTDVPTLTSPTQANFCTLNNIFPLVTGTTWSNGNLTIAFTAGSAAYYYPGTMLVNQGKWFFEGNLSSFSNGNVGNNFFMIGFKTPETTVAGRTSVEFGWGSNGTSMALRAMYIVAGTTITNTVFNTTTPISTDIFGIAYNADAGSADFYKNGSLLGSITGMSLGEVTPVIYRAGSNNAATWNLNFGQRPFAYSLPTGFNSINTDNLPTPAIPNGANQFAATLYTGTGATLSVTNTLLNASFQPDFVWFKGISGATNHSLYDSVRGTTRQIIITNATETTEATGLTAFNSNGFTVGALANVNTSTATYVAWNWKAGGTAVTNTAGTITSQVSANPTAGVSVVTYTGTGVNATVGHGLGIAPKFLIVKARNVVNNWIVWHTNITGAQFLLLNGSNSVGTGANVWNSTIPTSTVFSVGTNAATNASATTYVAYCFSEIAGFSRFGGYISTGLAEGPFVITGFRPRYIMIKETSVSRGWIVFDTSRSPFNVVDKYLFAETASAQGTLSLIDIVSNGFRLKSTNVNVNDAAGNTFIYMAFAENPFSYSLAR